MYQVNNQTFSSFLAAVAVAKVSGSEVFDSNGARRWHPAPAVSAKKTRMYEERLAAYNAQQAAK